MDRYEVLTADVIRSRMRTHPNDRNWAYLVRHQYVAEALDGLRTVEELDEIVRENRADWAPEPRSESRDATPPALADWAGALAGLLATEAGRDPELIEFRKRLPNGSPFDTFEGANKWLADVAKTDLNALVSDLPRRATAPERSAEAAALTILSARLAKAYGWNQRESVAFVLTGRTPSPSVFTVKTTSANPNWLNRITLTVHPMVDPKAVSAAYTEAREHFKGWCVSPNRVRTRERRVYEIAAWVARNDADSWPDLFNSWKAEHPDEAVADASTFRRYATRGLESLCGPGQRWSLRIAEDPAS